ncbi:low-density lipoprotein receptor-related protein 2-like [Dreissena polymorpha]|nr:low-density lipoprotein receptor-related protein 2-like [Dreissena polymorpha]
MGLIVVLCTVAMLSANAHSQTMNGTEEKGLIFTARNTWGTSAALWHLPTMPAYDEVPKTVDLVPFNDPFLQFYSLDVDYRKNIVYIYERHYRSLLAVENYTASMDHITSAKPFHLGISSGTVQIAVDWLSHTIYWTDSTYRWIAAAPGAIEKMNNDIYKIIADTNLYYPDGITLDPLDGFLFWTDNGLHPKIERSDMAGRGRKTLITDGLISPISMETDIANKRIYWIDTVTENIESSKYDGTDRVTLKRITLSTLFDLAIFRDVLAVTDVYNNRIMFFNTTNREKAASSIYLRTYITYNIATYFLESQPWRADDPCLDLNCTHMCITTSTGGECACAEGFVFNKSTNSCDENSKVSHRAMILTDDTSICLTDIRVAADTSYDCVPIFYLNSSSFPNNILPPNASRSTIAYMDVNMKKRVLYIADSIGHIFRRPVDLPKEDIALDLLTTASGSITGLAYDWTDNSLYWSQSDGTIYVINVGDSATRRVLANAGNITNLVVMPHVRRLGFTTDGTIKSVLMDGTNMTTVFSEENSNTTISELVVDYDEHMFYWVSTDSTRTYLYKMTIYGNENRTTINNNIDRTTSLLAVYKGYIKWMYPNPVNSSRTYYKSVSKLTPTVSTLGYFNLRAVAMKMLDASVQNMETDKCAYLNGGCEQICISYHTDENTFEKKCECSAGYTPINTNCILKTISPVDFAIVYDTTNTNIMQIDLRTNEQAVVPLKDVSYVFGLLYDIETKRIIWSERDNPIVYSAFLNGTGVKVVGKTGNSVVRRFAKDETTGNIYYTSMSSSLDQHVGVITPSGETINLVDDFSQDAIGSIAVHPGLGKMYYSVSAYPNSYMAEANMDGSYVRKFITDVDTPDGLAIDYINNFLYWTDVYENTIRRCNLNLNGTNCSTIINETESATVIIRDLVVEGDIIFYTDYEKDSVVAYNMTGKTLQSYGKNLGRLADLVIYTKNSANKQPANKACQSNNGRGDCSAVCLPKGSTERTCKCNTGENLQEDGRTCSNVYKCNSLIVQSDSTRVTISSMCDKRLNDVCAFQCPDGYIVKNASVLVVKCLNDGWDMQTEILCIKKPADVCNSNASLSNGRLNNCFLPTVGSTCNFTCDTGYVKSVDNVMCSNSLLWIPNDSCKATTTPTTTPMTTPTATPMTTLTTTTKTTTLTTATKTTPTTTATSTPTTTLTTTTKTTTPTTITKTTTLTTATKTTTTITTFCMTSANAIPNGYINTSCVNPKAGHMCSFSCQPGYTQVNTTITCDNDAKWDPANPCQEILGVTGSQVASAGGSSGTKIGMGLGIAIALVVVIAGAVAMFVFIKRRRLTEVPYSNASFHREDENISIENPGYMTTGFARMNDHGIDPSHMDHVTFDPLPTVPVMQDEDGFVNPLYGATAQPGDDIRQQPQNGEPFYSSSHIAYDNNTLT